MTFTRRTIRAGSQLSLLLSLLACALPLSARAEGEPNRLRRIQITPHQGFTRINLFFQNPPEYTLSLLPGRVRLQVRGADSPLFRKLRGYSDPRLGGLFCSLRAGGVRIEIPLRQGEPGVQAVSCANPSVLSLDVGPALKRGERSEIAPGREPILAGTARFMAEFSLPATAGLRFVPTDPVLLGKLLTRDEAKLFQAAEGLLYREQGGEALPVFASFTPPGRHPALRAVACYRKGEALALLGRNEEALASFREGEALWPGYLEQAPALLLCDAELLAKKGDFTGAKSLMLRLVGRMGGALQEAELANRLADLAERRGERGLAAAIYRGVATHASGTAAAGRALMKLADREMLSQSPDRYPSLLRRYRSLYEAPGEFALRDELLFKMALLEALYAPPREALEASVTYNRRYPRGIFSAIVRKMREELIPQVYRELEASRDPAPLVRLVLDNREYLAGCFADPDFPARLAKAFHGAGMLTREIELFGYLAERSWASGAAPFLTAQVVEDSLSLGRSSSAEQAGRDFLERFPRDAAASRVRELLGRIAFERGDLKGALAELRFLAGGKRGAAFPESDYYLGKALAAAGEQRGAAAALARFTAASPERSPYLWDGYFALAGARVALRDYRGALSAYRHGAEGATGESAEQFLYKEGEIHLKLGEVKEARSAWEKVASRGGEGTWVKLAGEALGDLKWRLKIAGELP